MVRIGGHNAGTLSHAEVALMAAWDVDAAITVETRTSLLEAGARSLALRDVGYEVHWGPLQPKRQDKHARPYTPAGGTAISLKGPVKPVDFSRDGELAQLLADSRRFVHAGLPYGRGADCVHLMGFYGIADCNLSPQDMALQKRLLTATFGFAMSLGDVPCVLYMDANMDVRHSAVFQHAVCSGDWCDVGARWHSMQGRAVPATFSLSGAWDSREVGGGRTRIDLLLANRSAARVVSHYTERWDQGTDLATRRQLQSWLPAGMDVVEHVKNLGTDIVAGKRRVCSAFLWSLACLVVSLVIAVPRFSLRR